MKVPTKAQLVSTWQDDRVTGAALVEHEDSSGWKIIFERAATFTDEDRAAGQDTYRISNETGKSVYGGVIRWSVEGSQLLLTTDERISEDLEIRSQLAIAIPAKDAAELRSKLAVILA